MSPTSSTFTTIRRRNRMVLFCRWLLDKNNDFLRMNWWVLFYCTWDCTFSQSTCICGKSTWSQLRMFQHEFSTNMWIESTMDIFLGLLHFHIDWILKITQKFLKIGMTFHSICEYKPGTNLMSIRRILAWRWMDWLRWSRCMDFYLWRHLKNIGTLAQDSKCICRN